MTRFDAIRVVGRMTALDLLRRPGTWTMTILTGVLFALLFAGFGFVTNNTQARAERISFAIAVDGDVEGATQFLESLKITGRLGTRVVASADSEVTASRAAAGLTLPEGLDARIERGEETELRTYYRAANNNSQDALNTLLVRIQEIELARTTTTDVGGAGVPVPQLVEIETHEIRQDPRVNRNQFAASLAAMACVLCLGTVSSVTALFGRSQEQRTLEPFLLLPLDRATLTAGMAAGAFPVAVLQLVAAQALLIGSTALPVDGLQQPSDEVLRMGALGLVAALVLGGLATVVGCLAGVIGVGSDDAVGMGDFLAIPFVAVGMVLFLAPDTPANAATALVPILGAALALRDAVRGTVSPVVVPAALLASVGWGYLLLRLAAGRIDAERRLLRATR